MGSQLFHFLLIQGTIMKIYILTRGTEVFIGYWHDLAARFPFHQDLFVPLSQ